MATTTAPKMVSISNLEVFASGTVTDSQGVTREITEEHLDMFVKSFERLFPRGQHAYLKTGHTTDEFNQRVATQLGVPVELVKGEGYDQDGNLNLGMMNSLKRINGKLIASFESVPEVVGNLVKQGLYDAVSAEVTWTMDSTNKIVDAIMTAVALLGGQDPAVGNLTPANESRVYTRFALNEGKIVQQILDAELSEITQKFEESIRGKRGAPIFRSLWKALQDSYRRMNPSTNTSSSRFDIGDASWLMNVVDDFRSKNPKTFDLPIEFIEQLCPPCAAEMSGLGIEKLVVRDLTLPQGLKKHMAAVSPEGFFGRLIALNFGEFDPGNKEGFSAWMQNQLFNTWPTTSTPDVDADADPNLDLNQNPVGDPAGTQNTPQGGGDEGVTSMTTSTGVKFEISAEDAPRILEALGLPMEATIDDVLAKITEMMPNEEPPPDEEPPMDGMMASPQFKALKEQADAQGEYIKKLEHTERVSKFTAVIQSDFPSVPGKPEEIAERLAILERDGQKETLEVTISSYKAMEESAKQLGITQALGSGTRSTSTTGNKDPFEEEMETWMKENSKTLPQATVHFSQSKSKEFGEYHARVRVQTNKN